MNPSELASNLERLAQQPFDEENFPYSFIEAHGAPKATISKLKTGRSNKAKVPGDVLWARKLYYRHISAEAIATEADTLLADPLVVKHKPRFILTTNGKQAYARDTKLDQTLQTDLDRLDTNFDFFLPLAGIEKHVAVSENQADVKAAERLAKLYDTILAENPTWAAGQHSHELNLLMTRLLFCFFAQGTGIFEPGLFIGTLLNLTKEDGSDTSRVVEQLFRLMDTPYDTRGKLSDTEHKFPYVNGGLFHAKTAVPHFSSRARRLLKECGELTWRDINPDIFGSIIQAVVNKDMRGDLGMHYTSVPNIMKVLQPLFLTSLHADFDKAYDSELRLQALLQRIYAIRIFDPACGSGNFLIIAYKELRKLEMAIFQRLSEVADKPHRSLTQLVLSQFFGIELTDFAAETAKLSLWIAEHQMNAIFKETFGSCAPTLPLRESGSIVTGNALRIDWYAVCPRKQNSETYLVGNPPYLGSSQQDDEQKADLAHVLENKLTHFKNLDLVSGWFIKAAEYISPNCGEYAFVATNSICQGEQVPLLWPHILASGLEISFAYQSFKWKNNASRNAGVTCVVIGIGPKRARTKYLFSDGHSRSVRNIGPYLTEMDDIVVVPSHRSTFDITMEYGNKPTDGGNLLLSHAEKCDLLSHYPDSRQFLRRIYGSREYIQGIERWCLWIHDAQLQQALAIPPIRARIAACRKMRLNSVDPGARSMASRAHQFREMKEAKHSSIIIPRHSSETRRYLPVGTCNRRAVITDSAFAIYDPEPWVFSVLVSRLHAIWTSAVGGHLEDRLRYSNTLVYNTFPMPSLSDIQKNLLERHAQAILMAREHHPGKTIAWMYDPDTMPEQLRHTHEDLDRAIEDIYIGRSFRDDNERLEHLFKLYAKATGKQQQLSLVSKPKAKKDTRRAA